MPFFPETHDEFGRMKVYPSYKPSGTTTYFTGAGDAEAISDGQKIVFNMTANDSSKSVDISFNEDIYILGGGIMFDGAPLGACMDLDIVHPQAGVVASFGRSICFMGTGHEDYVATDRSKIDHGLSIRITIRNADSPAAFKVCGYLIIYRSTTI